MTATTVKTEYDQESAEASESPGRSTPTRRRFSLVREALNPDFSNLHRPKLTAASQFGLIGLAAALYFVVRGLSMDQEREAFTNAASLLDFERALGIDWEAAAQNLILEQEWIVTAFNWVYIYLHWPLIIVAVFFLYRYSKGNYLLFRNALITSGAIGLFFFALYPVAPPRLFDPASFFDSVTEMSQSYKILQNPKLVNKYAALPSFHVGWNLLVGVALFRATRIRIIRFIAVASPILMCMAVVLTANHWIVDIVAGAGIALIGLGVAHLLRRDTARPTQVPSLATSDNS